MTWRWQAGYAIAFPVWEFSFEFAKVDGRASLAKIGWGAKPSEGPAQIRGEAWFLR